MVHARVRKRIDRRTPKLRLCAAAELDIAHDLVDAVLGCPDGVRKGTFGEQLAELVAVLGLRIVSAVFDVREAAHQA